MQPFDYNLDRYGAESRLAVIGPPGTGKTRAALTAFALPALEVTTPDRVLCCSFSNAAADEMRTRAAKALGIEEDQKLRETFSTIHSEALRRIKRVNPDRLLYDGVRRTVKKLSRNSVPESVGHEGADTRAAALAVWDVARARRLTVDDIPALAVKMHPNKLWHSFKANIELYEREKRDHDAIDFTDMLLQALHAPDRELDLLLVDEAQDCTPLQWALIDKWACSSKHVVVIGDLDQCVHTWAGASYSHFAERVTTWPARVLSQSYRVPRNVHAAARSIITRNADRVAYDYAPRDHNGAVVTCKTTTALATAIEATKDNRSCLMLARTHKIASYYARMLKDAGVPIHEVQPLHHAVQAVLEFREFGECDAYGFRLLVDRLAVRESGAFIGTKKAASDRASNLGDAGAPVDAARMAEVGILSDRLLTPPAETVVSWLQGVTAIRAQDFCRIARNFSPTLLTEPPAVRLLTMHASKGLEAEDVVVCASKPRGVEQDQTADSRESERRVLYVAATRARDRLFVDCSGVALYFELSALTDSGDATNEAALGDEVAA